MLPEHPRPLLMLTAGSGLTPVMSMIRTLVPRRPDADVVLIHSARTREDALFHDELLELADQFPGLTVKHWFTREEDGRRLDLSDVTDLETLCPDWRERGRQDRRHTPESSDLGHDSMLVAGPPPCLAATRRV